MYMKTCFTNLIMESEGGRECVCLLAGLYVYHVYTMRTGMVPPSQSALLLILSVAAIARARHTFDHEYCVKLRPAPSCTKSIHACTRHGE